MHAGAPAGMPARINLGCIRNNRQNGASWHARAKPEVVGWIDLGNYRRRNMNMIATHSHARRGGYEAEF